MPCFSSSRTNMPNPSFHHHGSKQARTESSNRACLCDADESELPSPPKTQNLHLKHRCAPTLFPCSLLNRHASSPSLASASADGQPIHSFSSAFADRTDVDRQGSYGSFSSSIPLPLPNPASAFETTTIIAYPLPLPCTSERASSKMEWNHSAPFATDQTIFDVPMSISSSPPNSQQLTSEALHLEFQPLPRPTCKDLFWASGLKHFKYEELSDACQNFSPASCVDDADRCFVGTLKSQGRSNKPQDVVIVRIPETWQQQRFQEWAVEMASLQEDHVCKLLGFFGEGQSSEYMLVYESLQKGSLNRLLFDSCDAPPLDWSARVRIAYGAAKGLSSLHERWPEQALYWDFRASSVQVDMDYTSKVCGYRFVNTLDSSTYMSPIDLKANPRLFAYQAPETASRGLVTSKSNVWSFGVLLVELLTGKQNMLVDEKSDLVNWAKPFLTEERRLFLVMDPQLQGRFPLKGLKIVADLALQCLETDPMRRPSMKQVLDTLKQVLGMRYTTWYVLQEPAMRDKFASSYYNGMNDYRKASSLKKQNVLIPMLGNSTAYRKSVSCGAPSLQLRNRAPAGVIPLVIPSSTCWSTFAVESMNAKHQRECHAPSTSPSPLPLPLPS